MRTKLLRVVIPAALALVVMLAVGFVPWLKAQAQGTPGGLVVGHQQAVVGNSVTVPTALQSLPNGLVGFQVNLRTTDPSVAVIEAVIVNAKWAFEGLSEDGFKMTVVDFDTNEGWWVRGAGFSPLFDTRLDALTPGQTTLEVEMLTLQDEDGNPMATSTAGVLIVVQ